MQGIPVPEHRILITKNTFVDGDEELQRSLLYSQHGEMHPEWTREQLDQKIDEWIAIWRCEVQQHIADQRKKLMDEEND